MPNPSVSDPNSTLSAGTQPTSLPTAPQSAGLASGNKPQALSSNQDLSLASGVVKMPVTGEVSPTPTPVAASVGSASLSSPIKTGNAVNTHSASLANSTPQVSSVGGSTTSTNASLSPLQAPSAIPTRSFSKPSPVAAPVAVTPVSSPAPSTPNPGIPMSVNPPGNTQPIPAPKPTAVSGAVAGMPPSADSSGQPPQKIIDSGKESVVSSAKPPRSNKVLKLLPVLVIVLVIVGALGAAANFLLNRQSAGDIEPGTTPQTQKTTQTLTYWGLWEPGGVVSEVLADFETQNPGVQVDYVQQSPKQYRDRLQTAIVSGSGPDVFRYHASWVPMMRSDLAPLPEKIMPKEEFSSTFYPIAESTLTHNGEIVGMPLMYEGLGLYYNKEIFRVANLTPADNWEELKKQATDLTIRSGNTITRAGIALGTAANVEHFSDILGLMMLQNGANPADPTSTAAQEALSFYVEFASTMRVWDSTMPSSTVAFARGDVAMMLAPSWRVHEIKALNPDLDFDIVPVPQLTGAEEVAWASFWAEGVNSQSRRKELAWELLKYLSSAEVQKKFYEAAKQERAFGPLYSRVDLAGELQGQPYVGAYMQDAPVAQTWYMNSYTHDEGLNDKIIEFYKQAIDAGQIEGAAIKQGVDQVLQQYGLAGTVVPAQQTQ